MRIHQIVKHERCISADTALSLARYFGTSADVRVRMQRRYDLELAQTKLERTTEKRSRYFEQFEAFFCFTSPLVAFRIRL
jgi:plasmid maintenance system antidote protein VapI